MTDLYPEITPFNEADIAVSDLHTVHYEQCGNPDGKPVLFVHGGPGGGIDPYYRRFFNPDKYRVILVDQRGCGQSRPLYELQDNTTQDLIADFEKIRVTLGIEKWMVFGGSWGSTLSLAYAQSHPDRVTELVLRGIYLGTDRENTWLFGGNGANYIYPDYWEDFIAVIPESQRDNLLSAYYHIFTGADQALKERAAKAWSAWEVSISQLDFDMERVQRTLDSTVGISLAMLECHYMYHQCFLQPNQLLANIDVIRDIPGVIVHGRYDMVCAPKSAWELAQTWPQAELIYVPAAGHSMAESAIASELVRATDAFVGIVR